MARLLRREQLHHESETTLQHCTYSTTKFVFHIAESYYYLFQVIRTEVEIVVVNVLTVGLEEVALRLETQN
jgi:hypothetical protein